MTDVLVIGAGVAGASVAYFLASAGARVTVLDAGFSTASTVPAALLNPVRGQSGAVDAGAVEGMALTWALVQALTDAGYDVPYGKTGVLRPVPDVRTRARFEKRLPADLAHNWLTPGDSPVPLSPGWDAVLHLPAGGWLDGAAFTRALLAASAARVVRGRARKWNATSMDLDVGTRLEGGAVVWCGGSIGASWIGANWAGHPATHRAGTMLLLSRSVCALPISFGAYLSPAASGGVLGATFEQPSPIWNAGPLPLGSLDWLLKKGEALADLSGVQVTGRWSASRLSGLQVGQTPQGWWQLTGLGSKGFLLGPLWARELAGQVAG
ncbi:FAD-binding oxidoreductase [Deinococcus sp. QL22]|uniref:NAD(P)/FAD-dependent oxidoreductase n=1 Tax=Deinococcus sp. QL22 TaxID=2939437 RepID=UPI002017FC02|nr:FAD-dependent oxidoreductase [Deinococcus sp. QL22]UQN07901.1 FAD-binding oxidoreductase [Deinococcus sp. QL22]